MAKQSTSELEYRHSQGSVSSCNYHFIFCPKRRKKVLVGDVARRLQEIIFEICAEHGWRLTALEVMSDHVHMLIDAPPHESPSQMARWVKGRASHELRQEFPDLLKMPCMWSRSYFVSTTGKVSNETVKKYVEGQRGK